MKKSIYTIIAVTFLACIGPEAIAGGASGLKERMLARAPQLAELKKQKIIGENLRGLVQVTDETKATAEAKQLVAEENRDRLFVYQTIAKRQGAAAEKVGEQRATAIYLKAVPGVMLQAKDGTWSAKE